MGEAQSLRRFQWYFSFGYALLIVCIGALGVAALRYSEEVSAEGSRLAEMEASVHQIRGNLYRQVKEVFDGLLLDDADAQAEFAVLSDSIESRFAHLSALLRTPGEQAHAAALRAAYFEVQRTGWTFMTQPAGGSRADLERRNVELHTAIETGAFQRYEDVLAAMAQSITQQREQHSRELRFLGQMMTALLLVSATLAAALMMLGHRSLRRQFVRPVARVLGALDRIRHGDLDARVPETGVAELKDIAHGINAMAADLHRSRRDLVRAEKQAMLGALVPVVAHNVRNPLASIRATAQVVDDDALSEDVRGGLRDIVAVADRLDAWTQSLLTYLNPLQPQCTGVCLQVLVDTVIDLIRARVNQRGLSLQRVGWEVPLQVEVDACLVEQAVAGFLLNAIEASPAGGLITLCARAEGAQACLLILDEGPGISHVPGSGGLGMGGRGPSTKPDGHGLGIPFGIKVIDDHGGCVAFRNTGNGTEVRVTLPMQVPFHEQIH